MQWDDNGRLIQMRSLEKCGDLDNYQGPDVVGGRSGHFEKSDARFTWWWIGGKRGWFVVLVSNYSKLRSQFGEKRFGWGV